MSRVTLVTGAGSGIGAAVCRAIAGPGEALLVHTGHARARAEAVAADVVAVGGQAMVVVADFAEPARAGDLVTAAVAQFGGLDRVVHVAGHALREPIGVVSDEALHAALATIPRAFLALATAALPHVRAAGRAGRVVTVGSFVAHAYRLGEGLAFPATAAAKAALLALTKSLAMQVASDGTTVNCVVPGFVEKDAGVRAALDDAARARVAAVVPMGRFATTNEVAAVIAFLLGDAAGYVTGQAIHVDGGLVV